MKIFKKEKFSIFIICLLMLSYSTRETGKVKGRMLPVEGRRNWGITITIPNTDIETSTFSNGYFEMEVPAGKHILLTHMFGYNSVEIPIEVKAGRVLDLGTFEFGCYHNPKDHDMMAGKPDLKAEASELQGTIVTPHLEQEIEQGKNVLWCGTFQLAWNEFCDLAEGPVEVKPPSTMIDILNKKNTTKADLDEKDYVAIAGKGKAFLDEIFKELERKFEGAASPELLKKYQNRDIIWITYAYLFKQMPFEHRFHRHYNQLNFKGELVDYFGVPDHNDTENLRNLAEQVIILDYENNDDFIIEIKTTSKDDRLILAKLSPKKTLKETVKNVETRIGKAKSSKLRSDEFVRIPVFNFDILREYNELYGRIITAKSKSVDGTKIDVALQSIRFRLDETGAILKSEAIAIYLSASMVESRYFVFDKPFLILIKRKNANNPYFALWVGNPELLVSTGQD